MGRLRHGVERVARWSAVWGTLCAALACAPKDDLEVEGEAGGNASGAAAGSSGAVGGGADVGAGGNAPTSAGGAPAASGSGGTNHAGDASTAGTTGPDAAGAPSNGGAGGSNASAGGVPSAGMSTGGAAGTGGTPPVMAACEVDEDCFDGAPDPGVFVRCLPEGCACGNGSVTNPDTGRCRLFPGSYRFSDVDPVASLAAAGQEHEGALLLGRSLFHEAGGATNRVVLQRFEPSGARIGDGVELSVAEEANALVNVAMASDGAKYLYCWSSQKKVHCGLFEPPAAHTPEIFEADGATVAVAFAGDTWLVAYLSANFEEAAPEFVLQALSRDGHAIAPARRLSVSNGPGHYEPILGAAGEEFVLIARNAAAEYRPHVYWLSPELADLRPPVDLGPLRPKQGVIAAVPGLVAASLSEAYMSYLTLVGPDGEVVTHEIPGGGKQGRLEAVSATPEGVVASWFLPDSRLHAQAFTSTRDAPGALEAADWQWLTFPAGNRLIGARLFSNFRWSTAVIEVVPLPEAL